MPEKRRLAAIMFTDIVGYTSLMGEDEERAYQLLKKNRQVQKPIIEKHDGKWLKEIGDGVLASFPTVSEAVYCAKEIQEVCEKEPDLKLRIGIHEGEVIFEDEDVFGDGVNIASRLEPLAPIGGIYVSESVFRNIENKKGIEAVFVREKTLKNVKHPVKIYEVKVEKGVKQTKPQGEKKIRSKLPYILVGALIVIITLFLIWKYLPKQPVIEKEKSIAVMPFDNESDDRQNEYFVNGMMEDIRNNLSKIGNLRVISKTSTEKYRETDLSTMEIAKELGVSYLLEGTIQKQGNQVKIHAQLIVAEIDDHIWTETYLRDLSEVFKVQAEIARMIANELYSTITPEEKEIIEMIPTTSISAYDFFLRARDVHTDYWMNTNNKNALERAITLYGKALENDSTYAQAYTGLALAYIDKHSWETYFEENYLDSVLVLTNTALTYNDQLDEEYFVRGLYYSEAKGDYEKAVKDLGKAIQINPNYSRAYYEIGRIYFWYLDDYVEGLKNLHKAARLDHSSWLPVFLRRISGMYYGTGFIDKAIYYRQEALKLDNDSLNYLQFLAQIEHYNGNFQNVLEICDEILEYDSTHLGGIFWSMRYNLLLENFQEAFKYTLRLMELIDLKGSFYLHNMHRLGYAFWQVGKIDVAKYYFDEQIRYCLESIRLNRQYATNKEAHYDLAGVYAFLGEKEKAYQYMDEYAKKPFIRLWMLKFTNYDPLYNSIREEERFQKILQNMEAKFQKEHNRVKVWLEEEGML